MKIIDKYPKNNEKFFEKLNRKFLGKEKEFNNRCKYLTEHSICDIYSPLLPIAREIWENYNMEYKLESFNNKIKVTVFFYNSSLEESYHFFFNSSSEESYYLSHFPIYKLELYSVFNDIEDNATIVKRVKAVDNLNKIWILYDLLLGVDLDILFRRGKKIN